jgi:membrane protease YdiL (CAAX protease family)
VVDPAPGPEVEPAPVGPPPIHPGERVAAAAEVILCSGFPTQILLIALLSAAGLRIRGADGLLSPPFIFLLSLLDTVLVVGLVLFFLRSRGESPRAVLLGTRPVFREALLGLALLPMIFIAVIAVRLVIFEFAPWLRNVPRNPLQDLLRTRGDAILFALVVMIAGGLREEVQRGFILHRFSRFLGGAATGLVLFSALFGLGHLEQGWDAVLATAALGACWGVVYLRRQSIAAPIVSHAAFNLAQLAMFLVVAQ